MPSVEIEEVHPLKWPDGWPRTRLSDYKTSGAWKKTHAQSIDALAKELTKLGVVSAHVTSNEKLGSAEPRDPGVALWFSRKSETDHSWQEILGIDSPLPTLAEIDDAFKRLGKKHHPDLVATTGGDPKIYEKLDQARKQAKAWVLGTHTHAHDYVIPCDLFKEVRWNITAIRLTIAALRQIERFGGIPMMERGFKGFAAALPANVAAAPTEAA